MSISPRLRSYLDRRGLSFEEIAHAPSKSAAQTAETAHIDRDKIAKAVLVNAGGDYMLAVVPASRHVMLESLKRWLGRDVRLADEQESVPLFADCDLGAIPPVGEAYNLETVMDESLMTPEEDVYFEGGDHRTLVHMHAGDWRRLMKDAACGAFTV
jgi:Ala-tRNA(Pro) deacylase